MPDYSNYQRKLIDRYYEHRDVIMLNKLQELISELYLAETDRKRDQLWKRVEKAMQNLKIEPKQAEQILAQRDPKLLASSVQDWLKNVR
jgi:hypothetical protein